MTAPGRLVAITSAADPRVVDARTLLVEYAESLRVDLSFQNFDDELSAFPQGYLPPTGALLVCYDEDALAGGIAMRRLDDDTCEMKRLYVRPGFRGRGIGRALAVAVIDAAREAGYLRMRLDTLPSMDDAQALYGVLGFTEIAPYYENPVPGTRYLELALREVP